MYTREYRENTERNTERELGRVELSREEFSPPCFVVCIVSKLDEYKPVAPWSRQVAEPRKFDVF